MSQGPWVSPGLTPPTPLPDTPVFPYPLVEGGTKDSLGS